MHALGHLVLNGECLKNVMPPCLNFLPSYKTDVCSLESQLYNAVNVFKKETQAHLRTAMTPSYEVLGPRSQVKAFRSIFCVFNRAADANN